MVRWIRQVNLWCTEQFDWVITETVSQDSIEMLENYCFTNFEDWKHFPVSYNDGTAEKPSMKSAQVSQKQFNIISKENTD